MGVSSIGTRTDGSLGQVKANQRPTGVDLSRVLVSDEWNRAMTAIIELQQAVGTTTDPGAASLEARMRHHSAAGLGLLPGPYDGARASTECFAIRGDGGGGEWVWDATSTTTENGGTVIGAWAQGRWKRVLSGGCIDLRWFGVKGNVSESDTAAINAETAAIKAAIAAAKGKTLTAPDGVYRFNETLYLENVGIRGECVRSPINGWGTYGGIEFAYHGTGVAMALNSVSGIAWCNFLVKSYASGQAGIVVIGTFPRMDNVWIQGFDRCSFRAGTGSGSLITPMPAGVTSEIGCYYGVFTGLNVQNTTVTGANAPLGFLVDSGASSGFSANDNTFRGCVAKGRFNEPIRIYGTSNHWIGGNTEIWSDVATPSSIYRIGGINVHITSVYCESGTASEEEFVQKVVRFESRYVTHGDSGSGANPHNPEGAWSCTVTNLHIQVGSDKIPNSHDAVENFGSNCSVEWNPVGFNLPGAPKDHGRQNLVHNSQFRAWDSTKPKNWHVSLGTWSRVTVDEDGQPLRAPYGVRAQATSSRFNLFCAVTDSGLHSSPNQISVAALRGQTLVASVWAWADYDPEDPLNALGIGNIQITGSSGGSVGMATISQPGVWQRLTCVARIDDSATLVGINLRSDNNNTNRTGVVIFTEPSLYLGSELGRNEPRVLTDARAQLFGPLTFSPFQTFADSDATPSVADGNMFNTAAVLPVAYANFDDGRNGQVIYIYAASGSPVVNNNANIQTSTGANKTLTIGQIYKFVHNGTKWVEF